MEQKIIYNIITLIIVLIWATPTSTLPFGEMAPALKGGYYGNEYQEEYPYHPGGKYHEKYPFREDFYNKDDPYQGHGEYHGEGYNNYGPGGYEGGGYNYGKGYGGGGEHRFDPIGTLTKVLDAAVETGRNMLGQGLNTMKNLGENMKNLGENMEYGFKSLAGRYKK